MRSVPRVRRRYHVSSSQPCDVLIDENVARLIKGHLISTVAVTVSTFIQANSFILIGICGPHVNPANAHGTAYGRFRFLTSTSARNVLAFQCLQPLDSDPSLGVNMRNWIWVREPRWRSCKKCFFLELCQPLQVHKPWDQGSVWNALLAAEERLGVNGFKRKWGEKSVSFISINFWRTNPPWLTSQLLYVCLCTYVQKNTWTMEQVLPFEWQLVSRSSPTSWEKVCDKKLDGWMDLRPWLWFMFWCCTLCCAHHILSYLHSLLCQYLCYNFITRS